MRVCLRINEENFCLLCVVCVYVCARTSAQSSRGADVSRHTPSAGGRACASAHTHARSLQPRRARALLRMRHSAIEEVCRVKLLMDVCTSIL
jgi:hypothetical protein